MTAIFTGLGAGFTRGSNAVLGGSGLLGSATTGRGGDNVMVNAATGNLVITRQDEFLVGRGPDLGISRTYNSLAEVSDRDNDDQWQMGTVRRVFGLTGTINTAGSTVRRQGADGSVATYAYGTKAGVTAYWATDGSGAHDKLVMGATWIWTDGASQVTETYETSVGDATVFRIKEDKDTDGYKVTFAYLAATDKIDRITTHNNGTANAATGIPEQSYMQYVWSGNNVTQIVTGYTDYGLDPAETAPADNVNRTLTRTRYGYDGQNRLTSVTVDLSPENNSIADGKTYVTTYTYHGTSNRVATIAQTDGSSVAIAYDAAGRVLTLTEQATATETRVTSFGYGASWTEVTTPDGEVTRLEYSGANLAKDSLMHWGGFGETREAAGTIDGYPAVKVTSAVGANFSGLGSLELPVAAGDAITFTVSLQAVAGSATTQTVWLFDSIGGGLQTARILSGPGQLSQTGEQWTVTGLSTSEATRIEVTRTYPTGGGFAAGYVYVDWPGGARDGQQLLIAGATLTKANNIAANSVFDWPSGGVSREAAGSIGGETATKFTSSVGASWSAISTGFSARAGQTYKFTASLMAVAGSSNDQSLGLYGGTSAWGPDTHSSARIVSGPGQIQHWSSSVGGLWRVTGLSTTEATRIEIVRTYTQTESAGAYVYIDHPGGYRDNEKLIVAGATVEAMGENSISAIPASSWGIGGVSSQAAGTISGQPAVLLTSSPDATWSATSIGTGYLTKPGDTLKLNFNLQAVAGSATEQGFGLYGTVALWGANHLSHARIVSGPGTIQQHTGGMWKVTGLSTSTPTQIEVVRTYDREEYVAAYLYVDNFGGFRDGEQLLFSGPVISRLNDYAAAEKQLTKIIAPPAYAGAAPQVQSFEYDADGNLTKVTDGAGEVTSYTYDTNGNLLTSTDPNGNLVTRTYGAKNEVLTETRTGSDASGAAISHTTRYAYDVENHLRYMVSADGYVTEYRYTASGQVQYVIEYPEHAQAIGSEALSEATMNAWRDAIADRSSTKIFVKGYDGRDNLSSSVDYGYATAAGGASTAEGYTHSFWTYDQAGKLLSRLIAPQNTETFVYDGLGRLTASTDLAGGTTTIVFNDAALTTTVTTAAGYISVSTYNKAGDLVGEAHSGSYDVSGSSSYLYDKNGRLRRATDATGHKSYYLYDKAGRKIADINHYGHVTEYRYDAAGRVAASASYTWALTAPQIATLDDPNSAVEMATIRPAAHSYDVWSWSIYDDAGRLIESIDGDGGVAVFSYDASNRLVKTVSYFNKLSAAQLTTFRTTPPTALVLPIVHATKDAVSRTFYDRDGRLIGTLDGEGYLSEVVYDKAGQKVEEVAFGKPVPTAPVNYRATGNFATVKAYAENGAGTAQHRRTRYVYDGQGLLRYAVDTAGYATQYLYHSDVTWHAIGLVRGTIVHAAPISTTDFTYDNVKALVAAIASDANDRESYNVYNTRGQVAYSIDAGGQVAGFAYDAAGRVTKSVRYAVVRSTPSLPTLATMDAWAAGQASSTANRVTRNWYTAGGDLRFSVDAEGYVRRFDYDAEGRLTREVTWSNAVAATDATTIAQISSLASGAGTWTDANYGYDAAGRRNSVYDGEGNRTVYTWYANGTLSSVYYAYGTTDQSRTLYVNDGAGRIKAEYRAYGEPEVSLVQYGYDGLGNRTTVTDANGKVTSYGYDERGQILTMTDAASGVTTYEYNAFGEVVKVTDPRGNPTINFYDNLGRVQQVARKFNATQWYFTKTTYTTFGEVASVIQHAGVYTGTVTPSSVIALSSLDDATTSFQYDKLGRVTKVTDALEFFEDFTYNAFGDRITAKNKLGATTTYVYDRRGLLTSEVLPMSSVDYNGTVLSSTVANSYAYDSRGNLKVETKAVGLPEVNVTQFEYDRANRLTHTIGQAFHTTLTPHTYFAYDARGNVTRKTAPDGARTIYYYDDLDRVAVEINAAGTYTAYGYDPNGNVTSIKVYETAVAVPADGGSEEEKLAAPSGNYRETAFTYDNLNRMTKSSVPGVTTGSFNGSTWTTASTAIETLYQYDAGGNVVKITDPGGNGTWAYYDALNRKTDQIDALGHRTRWTYDAEGNVTQERRYWNAAAIPANPPAAAPALPTAHASDRITDYTYDKLGNRKTETRLSVAVHNGSGGTSTVSAQILYNYNGLGQVTRKTEATADYVDYTYDTAGRLTHEQRSGYTDYAGATVTPSIDYYYNGTGNLTRTRQNGHGTTAARVTTYSYDGGKLRWLNDAEINDGTPTDGKQTWYLYDVAGNLQYEYYNRRNSGGANAGSNELEGIFRVYDGSGRVTQQWHTVNPVGAGGWTQDGPTTTTAYNAYGEVASLQVGTGALQQNQYDKAGRLAASNAGDGVWKYFAYDKNGNQTAALVSTGASTAGLTFNPASIPSGTAVTYTRYDARNLATHVHEPNRELTATTTASLLTQRAYNAFGEVAAETGANGATTTYSYNSMGRMIRSESPAVWMVEEDGDGGWIKPSEDYYYDKSGRLVATRDANAPDGTYALGASSATAGSKAANTGNLTRLTLLAGSGYGGSQALATHETHADGVKQTKYDIHGDARILIDEMNRQVQQTFDQMGRVIAVYNLGSTLTDTYEYDGLGQQLRHYNGLLGSGNAEVTDYDVQGRVVSQRAFGGDTTTTTYGWYDWIGGFGGWQEYRTMANGLTYLENTDILGRIGWKRDLGSHIYNYNYDSAGRLSSMTQGSATQTYAYFNTGKLRSITLANTGGGSTPATTYGYDVMGNLASQVTSDSVHGTTQGLAAAYDALGRMTSWSEAGNASTPAASSTLSYDAKGNVRSVTSSFWYLDSQGAGYVQANGQQLWYRYDAMDRVVVSKGGLSGGQITGGTQITYNAAGQRASVTGYSSNLTWTGWRATDPWGLIVFADSQYEFEWDGYHWTNNGKATYSGVTVESYVYDAAGRLDQVFVSAETGDADGTAYITATGTMGAAVLRGDFDYDAMGRLTLQQDYTNSVSGSVVAFSRSLTYDSAGRLTRDDSTTRRSATNELFRNDTSFTYLTGTSNMLGAANSSYTTTYKNGVDGAVPNTSTTNTYVWWDSALQGTTAYKPDAGSSTTYTTTYSYNAFAQLTSISIADGRPRTVTLRNSADGQAIRRDEADAFTENGDPHEVYYRLGGRQLGMTGNNGTADVGYVDSTARRTATQGTGAFQGGLGYGSAYADFGLDYDAINSFEQGSDGGLYTVQAGDTLQGIAQALWGDAALWYKLAEANGLSGASGLQAGRSLTIPTGVQRIHNNASTFKPYDPAEAIGDTSPTTPKPAKNNKCGTFGMILLAAVAVAVTIVTSGALAAATISAASGGSVGLGAGIGAAFGGVVGGAGAAAGWGLSTIGLASIGAAGAAAGSIVSQGVGVASGIQDKFSFKGVALAALSGGIGAGLSAPGSVFGKLGLSGQNALAAGARGALSSAAVQGVAVATGLQSKFDFAGVAAAGVGAGVGFAAGRAFGAQGFDVTRSASNVTANVLTGSARAIANAATYSAITGTSFGDNVMRALPDALGQTIGEMIAATAQGPTYLGQINRIRGNPNLSFDEMVAQVKRSEMERAVRQVEAALGREAGDTFRQMLTDHAELDSAFGLHAEAWVRGYDGLDGDALLGAFVSSRLSSGVTGGPGDMIVHGERTFGHAVAAGMVDLGDVYTSLSPTEQTLVELGAGILKGGPIGAAAGYAIDKVVEQGLVASGFADDVALAIAKAGGGGLSILSSSDMSAEITAASNDPFEASNLVVAGSAILGLASLGELARRWFRTAPESRWTAPDNFRMPSADKGRFVGNIGDSNFAITDDAADAMGVPRGSVVPWRQGIPDFGPYVVPGPRGMRGAFDVEGLTGNPLADRAQILKHMASKTRMSQRAVNRWLSARDLRLHHAEGMRVQIVPYRIHAKLGHSGGALQLRGGN